LQNAADACALAAARELTCDPAAGACPASYLEGAEKAGLFLASRNNKDFQDSAAAILADDVRFNTALAPNSNYLSRAAGADPASKYAMCIARRTASCPGSWVCSVSAPNYPQHWHLRHRSIAEFRWRCVRRARPMGRHRSD
jgi:hypothetical protein